MLPARIYVRKIVSSDSSVLLLLCSVNASFVD